MQVLVPDGAELEPTVVEQGLGGVDGGVSEWQCFIDGAALKRLWEAAQQPDAALLVQCERVYAQYPRKVGRPSALKAVAKALKKVSFEVLLNRTEKYAEAVGSWPAKDKAFVPHAATWYRDERFNDPVESWARASGRNGAAAAPNHEAGF